MNFLSRGGKRLRPRLCENVYRALAPDGTADLAPLLEAIECFHKASLIHDDIQDGDGERYGRPSVWREYGIPVAIAVGDWLLARGIDLVARAPFPNVSAMARLTSRAIRLLCEGQGDDLTGASDYASVCERKTGSLFALAAGLGALAADSEPEAYWDWGRLYGILFQVRDDLRDEGPAPERLALESETLRHLRQTEILFLPV